MIVAFWRDNDITLSKTDTVEQLRVAAEINPDLFVVALDTDGAVAGTVWGNFDGRRGFIVHLAVRRDLRGKSLGADLMERVEVRFREMGVFRVHLFVEKKNFGIVDYYSQRGFEIRDDIVLMSKAYS